jgi:hypothetical protein
MNLLWVSINCWHEGHDDLADELMDRVDDEGAWWLYYDLCVSILDKSTMKGCLCLIMTIIPLI